MDEVEDEQSKLNKRSVYVKHPDIKGNYDELMRIFSAHGKCKVLGLDRVKPQHPYIFLHYETQEQAEAAIRTEDNRLLDNFRLSVRFHISEWNGSAGSADRTVVVLNIPIGTTHDELRERFSVYGEVILPYKFVNYAFLRYETKKQAEEAIAGANNTLFRGSIIQVNPKTLHRPTTSAFPTAVYVSSLPFDSKEGEVKEHFSQYGNITAMNFNGRQKTAMITYEDADQAKLAVEAMNWEMFQMHRIKVVLKFNHSHKNVLVRVHNIPKNSTFREIYKRFSVHGVIKMPDNFGSFVIIKYESYQEAKEACLKEDKSIMEGKKLRVFIAHEKCNLSTVFVCGLPKGTPHEEIYGKFTKHGIMKMPTKFDYHVTIAYKTKEQAAKAIECENKTMFKGQEIQVFLKHVQNDSDVEIASRSVIVDNFPEDATYTELYEKFSVYGNLNMPKTFRHFLFINFETGEEADAAIKGENGASMRGAKIRVQKKKSRSKIVMGIVENIQPSHDYDIESEDFSVFVSGLSDKVTYEEIRKMFSAYGEMDMPRTSNSHTFITYKNKEAVEQAIKNLDGSLVGGQKINVQKKLKQTDKEARTIIVQAKPEVGDEVSVFQKLAAFGSIYSLEKYWEEYYIAVFETEFQASRAAAKVKGMRAEQLRPAEKRTLLISNIPCKYKEEQVQDFFCCHGVQASVKKSQDDVLMTFQTEFEVEKFLEFDGTQIGGNKITVRYPSIRNINNHRSRLIIDNCPSFVPDQLIQDRFSKYGEILLVKRGSTSSCLWYNDLQSGLNALTEQGSLLYEQTICVSIDEENRHGWDILVQNLPEGEPDHQLRRMLRPYGEIELFRRVGDACLITVEKSGAATSAAAQRRFGGHLVHIVSDTMSVEKYYVVVENAELVTDNLLLNRFSVYGRITWMQRFQANALLSYQCAGHAANAVMQETGFKVHHATQPLVQLVKHQAEESKGDRLFSSLRGEDVNLIEIVCLSPELETLCEAVEVRLKLLGLNKVDVLFPNRDISISKILKTIAKRGVLIAILPNEGDLISSTYNVHELKDRGDKHRNHSLDETVNLCKRVLRKHGHMLMPVSTVPTDMAALFDVIAEERRMSVQEYDRLIKFMCDYRAEVIFRDFGENPPQNIVDPPIDDSQNLILKTKQLEIQSIFREVLQKQTDL